MSGASSVGAVVLAAGGSSRLGRPKQLVEFEGRTLVRRAAEAALEAGCAPIIVITGARGEEVESELAGLQVLAARNESWREGLSTSVREGIEILATSAARAAILLPCDQPRLSSNLLRQMAQRFEDGARIVACEYEGTWGVPMLFERGLWPELRALEGDRGAKQVARAHADWVQAVPFAGGALDIDTEDDYRKLAASGS